MASEAEDSYTLLGNIKNPVPLGAVLAFDIGTLGGIIRRGQEDANLFAR